MKIKHENGFISVVVDESKFDGLYKEMAEGVNNMVNSHISTKKAAVAVFAQFSEGIFQADIDTLPNEKKFINETIDQVRNNLITLTSMISALVISAREGNLSARADSAELKGDWAVLVNDVNNLIDGITLPINETVQVLRRMADGDLHSKMTGDFKGDHALLKDNINRMIEQMPFAEAISVLEKVAYGDLTVHMTRDYEGDGLKLKNAINATVNSMNEVLSNVIKTVEEVNKGALQVADASTGLSQGATEQAASLEEITSSMTEFDLKLRKVLLKLLKQINYLIKLRRHQLKVIKKCLC